MWAEERHSLLRALYESESGAPGPLSSLPLRLAMFLVEAASPRWVPRKVMQTDPLLSHGGPWHGWEITLGGGRLLVSGWHVQPRLNSAVQGWSTWFGISASMSVCEHVYRVERVNDRQFSIMLLPVKWLQGFSHFSQGLVPMLSAWGHVGSQVRHYDAHIDCSRVFVVLGSDEKIIFVQTSLNSLLFI